MRVRLFTTVAALRCYLDLQRAEQYRDASRAVPSGVGLVPTMGALHAGHLSLIERARQENATVIVSIFVNPLQFGPKEDFQKYPRTLEKDRQLCEAAGADAIFAPSAGEVGIKPQVERIAAENHLQTSDFSLSSAVVPPASMTSVLCGRSRPGHFQGVCTIVAKLFNLVQPDRAYFGQKDAQQVAIIRRMVADLNIPVEIVPCPTLREPSGLAMSSRNQYLTDEQKKQASVLYRSLHKAETAFVAGDRAGADLIAAVKAELATEPSVLLEYVELVDLNTLMPLEKVEEVGLLSIAARLGSTRLIDNVILRDRQPIVAIDGPAGVGKSTVARYIARALEFRYLDTGAMYRAATWHVLQSGIAIEDEPAVAEAIGRCEITIGTPLVSDPLAPVPVQVDGEEVTQAIRTLEVTARVSAVSAQPAVRRLLVQQQQNLGKKGGLVAEGRDIGTNVFPDADIKIFLTASARERARRRQQDLAEQGQGIVSLEQLERDIAERDRKDSTRAVAPLQKAPDAIEIQTDGLSIQEVVERVLACYERHYQAIASR